MGHWAVVCAAGALMLLGTASPATGAPVAATGITLRIQQQMEVGNLNAATDYRARFLGDRQFRVEGGMTFTRPKETQIRLTVAGDGLAVRQIEQTADGPRATVMDMARMRKAIPDYDPVLTYDPRAYRRLLAGERATKLGEETLDGVEVAQYQADLPEGRLSLPANVPLGLPDPARVRVWTGVADGIARRVELEDSAGRTFLKVTFTEVRSGVPMGAADFSLKFPEKVTPRDITEMMIGLVSASRRPPAAPGEEAQDKPTPAKPSEKAAP